MDLEYQNWLEFKKDCPKVYPHLGAFKEVCASSKTITLSSGKVTEHTMEHECDKESCTEWKSQ